MLGGHFGCVSVADVLAYQHYQLITADNKI